MEKALINVDKSAVAAAQVNTTLVTVTFPCTIVGLRWDLSFTQDAGAGNGQYAAAIVVDREGQTANTLSLTDGSTLYQPEQDVMSYFSGENAPAAVGNGRHYVGSTKTMRKMMGGDRLQFIILGVATNTTSVHGTIQFFCKT